MSKIKLIACDLDGTLLPAHASACNPEVFPMIRKLIGMGVYFVPASGRQYLNLQKLFTPVKDDIMYLCENGALVMYLNQVLVKRQFEDALAMRICHAVLKHPDCEVVISGERTCYLIPKKASFASYIRDGVGNHITLIDSPERIEEPVIKVSYYTSPEQQASVTAYFEEVFREEACIIVTSGNQWVDFAPEGTGKGAALKEIGRALGISSDEMAAFGDNENDRTMLEYVGHPYLMKECNPTMEDVKAKRCERVETTLREILQNC